MNNSDMSKEPFKGCVRICLIKCYNGNDNVTRIDQK